MTTFTISSIRSLIIQGILWWIYQLLRKLTIMTSSEEQARKTKSAKKLRETVFADNECGNCWWFGNVGLRSRMEKKMGSTYPSMSPYVTSHVTPYTYSRWCWKRRIWSVHNWSCWCIYQIVAPGSVTRPSSTLSSVLMIRMTIWTLNSKRSAILRHIT